MPKLSPYHRAEALAFASQLADAAEDLLRRNTGKTLVEMKPDDTPVTSLDRAIEQMVVDRVAQEREGEEVLGEEGRNPIPPTGGLVWVVDPIDGTEALIKGVPGHVFSAALVVDGRPEVALVRDLTSSDTWTATTGDGAWLNPRHRLAGEIPMEVNYNTAMFSSMAHQSSPEHPWPEVVSVVNGGKITPLNFGSVIRAGMDVAEGGIDGIIFGRYSPWDMATVALIVTEAGGEFTDLLGRTQRLDRRIYGGIASNGLIHEDLVRIVADQLR